MNGPGINSSLEGLPARLLNREPEAFQDFARAFGAAFRRFLLSRGLKPFEAEDLAITLLTDIPIKVIKGQFKEREQGTFKGWVFALVKNAANDWWRKRHDVDLVPIREDAATSDDAPPDEGADLVMAVRDALTEIPGPARQIIELRDLHGGVRDYADIASHLGISSGAARVRHSRALAQLAGILVHDPRLRRALLRAQHTNSST
jgi:RNA polymerase sigma factor (sigma-70 family)